MHRSHAPGGDDASAARRRYQARRPGTPSAPSLPMPPSPATGTLRPRLTVLDGRLEYRAVDHGQPRVEGQAVVPVSATAAQVGGSAAGFVELGMPADRAQPRFRAELAARGAGRDI